jgi:hypothetical protein
MHPGAPQRWRVETEKSRMLDGYIYIASRSGNLVLFSSSANSKRSNHFKTHVPLLQTSPDWRFSACSVFVLFPNKHAWNLFHSSEASSLGDRPNSTCSESFFRESRSIVLHRLSADNSNPVLRKSSSGLGYGEECPAIAALARSNAC